MKFVAQLSASDNKLLAAEGLTSHSKVTREQTIHEFNDFHHAQQLDTLNFQ